LSGIACSMTSPDAAGTLLPISAPSCATTFMPLLPSSGCVYKHTVFQPYMSGHHINCSCTLHMHSCSTKTTIPYKHQHCRSNPQKYHISIIHNLSYTSTHIAIHTSPDGAAGTPHSVLADALTSSSSKPPVKTPHTTPSITDQMRICTARRMPLAGILMPLASILQSMRYQHGHSSTSLVSI
jgi:hypothetical protein